MFTDELCFDLLERFTGIRPTINSVGNPEVRVGEHYYITTCLMRGRQPMVEEGPEVLITLMAGGARRPVGSGRNDIEIGRLILRVLNDIEVRLDVDRHKADNAYRTCQRLTMENPPKSGDHGLER